MIPDSSRAASDILSGVQGGSQTRLTFTEVTPSIAETTASAYSRQPA